MSCPKCDSHRVLPVSGAWACLDCKARWPRADAADDDDEPQPDFSRAVLARGRFAGARVLAPAPIEELVELARTISTAARVEVIVPPIERGYWWVNVEALGCSGVVRWRSDEPQRFDVALREGDGEGAWRRAEGPLLAHVELLTLMLRSLTGIAE